MNERPAAPDGFSLVEIIAAIMILSFGLLTMAASTMYVAGQLRSARFDTQRNFARQQVLEQLRGTFYDDLVTNNTGVTAGGYTVKWVVANVGNNTAIKQVSLITTGPAYRPTASNRATRRDITDTAVVQIVSPK